MALALIGLSSTAMAQVATGEFSAAFLGVGNIDAQVGLSANKDYLYAINLGSTTNLQINGVNFTGVGGVNPVTAGFSLTGVQNVVTAGQNPGGQLGLLTTDFIYGGALVPEVVTFNGLTVGEAYVITFYNASWDPASVGRRQTMSASGASNSGAGLFTFDDDMNATAAGQFNLLRYTFNATSAQQLITFLAQVSTYSKHQYGFTVERTFNNTYVSGPDWTTAAWGVAGVPNGVGKSAAFASAGAPSSINLDANVTVGHLQFEGANAWTVSGAAGRTLTLQADVGGVSTLSAKSGSHVVNPNITLNNGAFGMLKVGAGSVTLNGNITGGTAKIHVSEGTLRLNGVNDYTGETVVNSVLEVNTLSDYGVASSIGARALAQENTTVTGVGLHFMGGTLRFVGSTPQSTNRNIRMFTGAAATLDASGTVPAATMSFTKTGANMNLFNTGGTRTLTLTGSNTGDNAFSIKLENQGANATSLTKSGAGTWVLNGPDANTATGVTTVSGGILKLAKTNAVAVGGALSIGNASAPALAVLTGTGGNQIADTGVVTLVGTGANAGILRLNGLNETIGGLASAAGAGLVESESGAAGTITLTLNVAGTQTYNGALRNGDGVGLDGTVAVTKIGAGTQVLAGTLSYTGATLVNAGTLTVNTALSSTSGITVSNATLNGTGTVAAPVTLGNFAILGGTGTYSGAVTAGLLSRISPGTAATAGTLSLNSLNLAAGSVADLEFGATNDIINITGAGGLALNGGAVNVFAAGGSSPLTVNGDYTLLDYTTNFTGPLSNLFVANAQTGKLYTIADNTANTQLVLTIGDASVTEWNGTAANGLWGDNANWTASQANSVAAVARFGTLPTTPTAVSVVGGKTAGNIIFDNASSYSLSGSAITLDNGFAAAVVTDLSGNHSIANPLILASNTNFNTAAATTLTVSGDVSGGRGLTKVGAGTLVLSGSNSYTLTTITAGTLQIGDGGTTGSLGSGDVLVSSGATLAYNRSNDLTLATNIFGGGGFTKAGPNTLTLTGNNVLGILNVSGGTLKVGSASAIGTTAATTLTGATLDLNNFNANLPSLAGTGGTITTSGLTAGTSALVVDQAATTTFDGTITDGIERTLSFTKAGAGILTLAGGTTNSFFGGATVSGGTLRLAKTSGDAIVSDLTVGDTVGADVLELGAANQIGDASVVTLNAGGSGNSAFLRINGFNETVKGIRTTVGAAAVIENNATAAGTAVLTVDTTGSNFTYDGIIRNASAGTSVFGLTKAGAGTLTLRNTAAAAATAYTGPTTIAGGTLVLDSLASFGATPITVTDGKLQVENLAAFGAASVTINSAVPGALTINTVTRDLDTAAPINGTGEFVKDGNFTVTLRGVGNFSGKTIVNSGTVGLGNVGVLGTSQIVMNGGILRAVDAGRVLTNPVTVNGSFTLGRLTDLLGPITLTANATITANNFDSAADNPSKLGPIGGNFRVSFAEGPQGIGTGSLNITATNTNSGGVAVLSGRLVVDSTGSLSNAPLVVNGGELNLNNNGQAVSSLSGTGGRINLAVNNTLFTNQAGDTTFAGVLAGGGAFQKDGAGSLTLSGASTAHTGATTLGQGILNITGSLSGSSLKVADGTLAGNGTISSTVQFISSGAKLAPGGVLTINGNVDLGTLASTSGSMVFDIGPGGDKVTLATGALTLSGTGGNVLDFSDFAFSSLPGLVAGNYTLFETNGLIVGGLGASISGSLGPEFTGTLALTPDGSDIILQVVPEPGSAALLLGGLALLATRRRRVS